MYNSDIAQLKRNNNKINTFIIKNTFRLEGNGYSINVLTIKKVLTVPPKNIAETASNYGEFSTFVTALSVADPYLRGSLGYSGLLRFTAFVPTNQAFADLLASLGLNSLDQLVLMV